MNTFKIVALASLMASSAAFAQWPAGTPEDKRGSPPSTMGNPLSLTIPVGGCEVVEATMTYLDSKGETRVMRYLRQGSGCHDF